MIFCIYLHLDKEKIEPPLTAFTRHTHQHNQHKMRIIFHHANGDLAFRYWTDDIESVFEETEGKMTFHWDTWACEDDIQACAEDGDHSEEDIAKMRKDFEKLKSLVDDNGEIAYDDIRFLGRDNYYYDMGELNVVWSKADAPLLYKMIDDEATQRGYYVPSFNFDTTEENIQKMIDTLHSKNPTHNDHKDVEYHEWILMLIIYAVIRDGDVTANLE